MGNSNTEVNIIIVSYNSKNYIKPCIESILNEDYLAKIIVVDNRSSDDTAEFIEKNFPSVRVIRSQRNLGYGAGNNLGVKIVRGEYIVMLNPDTIVNEGWLKELIKPLKEEKKLITTPKILIYDGSAIGACGITNHFTGLAFTRGFGAKPSDFQNAEYVRGLSGGCFAIRREDFLELGGFDENFFLYNEDSDLSWRAHLEGFKIIFVPSSVVRHDYNLKVPPEKIYHLEKGRYMIIRKYYSWKDFLILSPSLIITELLTFGYATRNGWKGIRYKLKAIKDGLSIKVNKEKGDKSKLFKSLSVTIPVEQLTFNEAEKIFKIFANKIFEWNFKMVTEMYVIRTH